MLYVFRLIFGVPGKIKEKAIIVAAVEQRVSLMI